jgi:tyrosinase
MFAIFQALHPNSYVEDEPTSDGTFTEPPGYTETVTSDLTPFWKDSSTFHTPETAKATIPLGYAYPETQSWNSTPALYQKSVRAALKRLYGTTISSSGAISLPPPGSLTAVAGFKQVNGTLNGKPVLPPVLSREINVEDVSKNSAVISTVEIDTDHNKQVANTSLVSSISGRIKSATGKVESQVRQGDGPLLNSSSDGASDATAPGEYKEWITNIRVQKHSLRGTLQVHVFLGDVPADANSWLTHANNVGTCSILGSNPATTSCEKCKKDASRGLIVTGVVPLTEAMLAAILQGNLRSLNAEDVVPYLAKMLHWRVTQVRLCSRSPYARDGRSQANKSLY